jgi:hypothetical protein
VAVVVRHQAELLGGNFGGNKEFLNQKSFALSKAYEANVVAVGPTIATIETRNSPCKFYIQVRNGGPRPVFAATLLAPGSPTPAAPHVS